MSRVAPPPPIDPLRPRLDPEPTYRPEPRFWPYLDVPEAPTDEELAALDPALRDVLFGPAETPFSITLDFPRFEGPDFARAQELGRRSREYQELGNGDAVRCRARFQPEDVVALRDLYQLVGGLDGTDVLVDGRPVPFARELWLPLLWYLLPR
jgi:hypothetical protein